VWNVLPAYRDVRAHDSFCHQLKHVYLLSLMCCNCGFDFRPPLLLKGKDEHLYSTLHGIQTTLKRSGMDHTIYLQ